MSGICPAAFCITEVFKCYCLAGNLQNAALVPPSATAFYGCYCQPQYYANWSNSTGDWGTPLAVRQGMSLPQVLCRRKLLLASAGIWDMTCVLKTLPKSSHLGLILAVVIPVAVALAAIGLLVLICWRFGNGFARQWEAMRIARLKRRRVLVLSTRVAAAVLLTR